MCFQHSNARRWPRRALSRVMEAALFENPHFTHSAAASLPCDWHGIIFWVRARRPFSLCRPLANRFRLGKIANLAALLSQIAATR